MLYRMVPVIGTLRCKPLVQCHDQCRVLCAVPNLCPIGECSVLDIIANNPMDQKVVDLSSSQHYSLVENAIYRSVFPPQGV